MADTIREKILDAVTTALGEITVANGYETTVEAVHRAGKTPVQVRVHPSIIVYDLGDTSRRTIRLTYHHVMRLGIVGCAHEHDDVTRNDELSKLMGDIRRKVAENETWSSNAIATIIDGSLPSEGESDQPRAMDRLGVSITYRTKEADPLTVGTL